MKAFITLCAVFAVASARGYSNQPSGYDQQNTYQPSAGGHYGGGGSGGSGGSGEPQKPIIPIIRSDSKHNHDGSYEYSYETGNGISVGEQGYVKPGGHKDEGIQVAQGYFQYTADDGTPISLKYVADENGFQPTGDHLPTPPPLPKEIVEALEKIAADPRHNDGDDGQYHGDASGGGHYQPQQHQPQQPQHIPAGQQSYYKY